MVNSNKSTGPPPRADQPELKYCLTAGSGPRSKAAAELAYRLVLNLYSTPTEMAKLTSYWAVFGP